MRLLRTHPLTLAANLQFAAPFAPDKGGESLSPQRSRACPTSFLACRSRASPGSVGRGGNPRFVFSSAALLLRVPRAGLRAIRVGTEARAHSACPAIRCAAPPPRPTRGHRRGRARPAGRAGPPPRARSAGHGAGARRARRAAGRCRDRPARPSGAPPRVRIQVPRSLRTDHHDGVPHRRSVRNLTRIEAQTQSAGGYATVRPIRRGLAKKIGNPPEVAKAGPRGPQGSESRA